MHLDTFLLDTNILSQAQKETPHPNLVGWLRRQARLAIPFPVLVELERGVAEAAANGSRTAGTLRRWLDDLLQHDFEYPALTPSVARQLGSMYACPPLQNLWYVDPKAKKKKLGHDLMIAAVALVHRMPIATLNTRDFALIDRHFSLPGVYHPIKDRWLSRFSTLKEEVGVPLQTEGLNFPWPHYSTPATAANRKLSATTFLLTQRQ